MSITPFFFFVKRTVLNSDLFFSLFGRALIVFFRIKPFYNRPILCSCMRMRVCLILICLCVHTIGDPDNAFAYLASASAGAHVCLKRERRRIEAPANLQERPTLIQ